MQVRQQALAVLQKYKLGGFLPYNQDTHDPRNGEGIEAFPSDRQLAEAIVAAVGPEAIALRAVTKAGQFGGKFILGSRIVTGGSKFVTVFRVEGTPNLRILVSETTGDVTIVGTDNMLFLTFGDKARAEQYLAQKLTKGLPGAQMKSFEVDAKFVDQLRRDAVPERLAKQFPDSPIQVDRTKCVFEKADLGHGHRLMSVAQAAMTMRVSATSVSCS